jgi:thiol-disulfide isomerase/thioredoxin
MLRKIALFFVFTSALAVFVISCGSENQAKQANDDTDQASTAASDNQSEFIFTAYDVDGVPRTSADWVGKQPVVLNFWGTWCPPCRKEVPDLVKVYDEYRGRGIEMLGLAVRDNPDNVVKFTRENKMNWIMLMADNSLAVKYRITGVPTTIFIDRNGNELGRFVGPQSYETFKQAFELALKS